MRDELKQLNDKFETTRIETYRAGVRNKFIITKIKLYIVITRGLGWNIDFIVKKDLSNAFSSWRLGRRRRLIKADYNYAFPSWRLGRSRGLINADYNYAFPSWRLGRRRRLIKADYNYAFPSWSLGRRGVMALQARCTPRRILRGESLIYDLRYTKSNIRLLSASRMYATAHLRLALP